jgi:DNA repair photolyase
MVVRQAALFPDIEAGTRTLPTLGEQSDIRYYATLTRSALNGPEVTGMGYWSINPYVGCAFGCAYCYARYAHRYAMERAAAVANPADPILTDAAELPPWLAFERRVLVKRNAPEVLRRTLRSGSARHLTLVQGDVLVIGTATDPYQPAERRFRVTRGILEVLAEHPGMSILIITKSPLVTRDIDLLSRIARRSTLTVHVSLITIDRDLARRLEPRAPTPDARLRALTRLSDAGIDAGVNCMPVLPGITDNPADLDALVRAVAATGATHLNAGSLALRATARERYLPVIAKEFPHLLERYRATYAHGHRMGDRYRAGLHAFFERTCKTIGIRYGSPQYDDERGSEFSSAEPAGPDTSQVEMW